jgi:hypothetical protein
MGGSSAPTYTSPLNTFKNIKSDNKINTKNKKPKKTTTNPKKKKNKKTQKKKKRITKKNLQTLN